MSEHASNTTDQTELRRAVAQAVPRAPLAQHLLACLAGAATNEVH
jgi:hypothetical protein